MKSSKSIILAGVFLLISASSVFAQKAHFSVNITPVIPTSFSHYARIGILSGSLGFNFDITRKISITLSAGYNGFGSKMTTAYFTGDQYKSTFAFLPVLAGIQYYFKDEGTRLFGVLKAGYYFPAADLVEGDFGINPGFGIQIPSKTGILKTDISISYNGVLGARTKVYEFDGSTTENHFSFLSYLSLNLGLVF
jgi:hypothetical protein